jgi:protein O-mannosyl-transferase
MSRQLLQAAALIAITFAAYFPTLHNGFIWDDDRYIEMNAELRTLHGLEHIWFRPLTAEPQYYPLTHTTFWIEYHLWGLKPLGYHLDNVLLQAMSGVLLWLILRGLGLGGAWVIAAIFCVHPLQVESVAWATERKNVLSGVFYFLALGAYLGFEARRGEKGKWIWYAASFVFFVVAILSKSVASTLPEVILLLCWWRRGTIRMADVWPLVPMLIVGIAMGSLTGWMEKHVVGAMGPEFDRITVLDRVCVAGRAFWFYLVKLVWPAGLTFIYPHWNVNPMQRPWWFLFPAAAVGVLLALWLLRFRLGRGPVTAAFFFTGTLMPALGFLNVFPMRYSFVADHFQFMACLGPIVLGVAAFGRMGPVALRRVGAGVVIAVLCIASHLRSEVYFDRRTLWTDTLSRNPDSAMVHNNLAEALAGAGDLKGAEAQYKEAIRLEPGDGGNLIGMGHCYAREGDYVTAMSLYQQALDMLHTTDDAPSRHYRAGRIFQIATGYQGLATEFSDRSAEYLGKAAENYRQAIELFPEYEDARNNLAIVLVDQGKYDDAIAECKKVIELNPDSVPARTNMGLSYYQQGRLPDALSAYLDVLKIEPENSGAMASAGGILAQMGRDDEAITFFREALQSDPENPIAKQNLAAMMARRSPR